jgi:hypothetical protein
MQKCIGGRLTDGTMCKNCGGTGRPIHTSGQDIIEVAMPETKDELVPLTDFVHYVEMPIELLKLQKEWIDGLKSDCHLAIFNSSVLLRHSFSKSSGNASANPSDPTATEVDRDMDSVNDTLNPFAEKVSSVWSTIVELITIITDNAGKVNIIHRFPSSFKLKTRQDLYIERKSLEDSGAPPFAVQAVDDELAEDIFADDPEGLAHYVIKKQHYPFAGKTNDQITQLMQSTMVLKKTKVRFAYFDDIFQQLEQKMEKENKDFYLLTYEEREAAIEAAVKVIIDELSAEQTTAFSFNNPGLPTAN